MMPFSDFHDRRVVVMGGTRGIGRHAALSFAAEGAHVAVCGRDPGALAQMAAALAERGGRHLAAHCDIGLAEEVQSFINQAAEALGGIDILINCASAFAIGDDEAAWAHSVAVDLLGTVRACHAAEPFLRHGAGPAIVNVASVAVLQATPNRPAYGATKAGIVHFTASLAAKLAADRIRVNCVVPGSTDFDGSIWQRVRESHPELYTSTRDAIPLGRFGTPEDMTRVIRFLASDDARWMTGQSLTVDGGQTLSGW